MERGRLWSGASYVVAYKTMYVGVAHGVDYAMVPKTTYIEVGHGITCQKLATYLDSDSLKYIHSLLHTGGLLYHHLFVILSLLLVAPQCLPTSRRLAFAAVTECHQYNTYST
jgi:hypothetical protein